MPPAKQAGLSPGGGRATIATMPELPDITVYLEAMERRMLDRALLRVRLGNPFLLRTAIRPWPRPMGVGWWA